MGQDRKDRKGRTRRINLNQELLEDAAIERLIGIRQIIISFILTCLVIAREALYPSHIIITEFISEVYSSFEVSLRTLIVIL